VTGVSLCVQTKRRVSALEVESWQGIGVGPMRRVRQRIATSASHGFFARAPTSSSSHGASGTFSPRADPFYPPQDTGNTHLGQAQRAGQALGQLVPGGSVGPGASGVAGG